MAARKSPAKKSSESTQKTGTAADDAVTGNGQPVDEKLREKITERQLVPTVQGTALEYYHDRMIIGELVDRLMSFHPAAEEVGQVGMRQAAQLAILMGASPLPATNEIHVWKDERGKITVAPGINYWRRRATYYGGVFWKDRPRPMTSEEVIVNGLADNELGAICVGMRAIDLNTWMSRGMTIQDALRSFSQVGLGSVRKNEYPKKGRPLIWSAIKRCETDLLKQLFPYQPGEKFEPGAGLMSADQGTYIMDEGSPHWAGLDMSLTPEPPTNEDEDDRWTVEETNDILIGDYGQGQKAESQKKDEPDELIEITYKGETHLVPTSIVRQGEEAIEKFFDQTE